MQKANGVSLPRLASIRKRQLLTQAELAARAGVGKNTVLRLERGAPGHYSTVRKIADALSVPPEDLMESQRTLAHEKEEPHPPTLPPSERIDGARESTPWDEIFTVGNKEGVRRFLGLHSDLMPLLAEASRAIAVHFPQASLSLEVAEDREVPDEAQLVLSIVPRLPVPEALERLNRFDEEWWLDRLPRAQDRLAITLAFE